jgi:molecular chaperone GrpE
VRKKDKGHTHAGPLRPSGRPPESEPSEDELAGLEAEDAIRAAAAESGGAALAEPAPEAVQRLETRIADLERQVVEWKDRALRTAADMENYRRRAIRERDEAATRGQADVLKRIMEVVDDLARVAHLDPVNTSSEALHEGMLAIERKFQRVLEASGVERIDPAGTPFDPNAHEAVTMMPAPGPEADGTVGAVFQPGYRLHGTLLRPARVAVLKWTAPAPPADLVH